MKVGTPFLNDAGKEIGRVAGIDPNDPTRLVIEFTAAGFSAASWYVTEPLPEVSLDDALARAREAFE